MGIQFTVCVCVVCVCVCVHTHTHMHADTYVCMCMCAHTHTYACRHACVYVYVCTHTHVCMQTRTVDLQHFIDFPKFIHFLLRLCYPLVVPLPPLPANLHKHTHAPTQVTTQEHHHQCSHIHMANNKELKVTAQGWACLQWSLGSVTTLRHGVMSYTIPSTTSTNIPLHSKTTIHPPRQGGAL